MLRPTFRICLLTLLCLARLSWADGDSVGDKPASDDPFPGETWVLTDYIKGNAAQIRDQMNGEVERLISRVNEAQRNLAESNKTCQDETKVVLARLRQTPEYKQAVAARDQAEADLAAARKSGTLQERLDASGRFNKARAVIEKMEHDATAAYPPLVEDRKRSDDFLRDLNRYKTSLAKATKWRNDLLDATRNAFRLSAPVVNHAKGTLPGVTIKKVIDEHHALVEYEAVELLSRGKDEEGVASFNARTIRGDIYVSGIDTSGLKEGSQTNFDRVFVIQTRENKLGDVIYLAKPFPSDADKLLAAVVPLKVALNPAVSMDKAMEAQAAKSK